MEARPDLLSRARQLHVLGAGLDRFRRFNEFLLFLKLLQFALLLGGLPLDLSQNLTDFALVGLFLYKMRYVCSIVEVSIYFAEMMCDGGEAFIAVKITVSAVNTNLRLILAILP